MNLTYIGIIALAIIAVGLLYFKIDGALMGTIVALIAGAAGFGVKQAKDSIAPSAPDMPVSVYTPSTDTVSVVYIPSPVKVAKLDDKVTIDFEKIIQEISDTLTAQHLPIRPMNIHSFLQARSVTARVSSLDEVKQWNSKMIETATAAVRDMIPIS